MNSHYLSEIPGNKEDEIVNRLFAKEKFFRIPVDHDYKEHFKVEIDFCLVGLRIPFDYIDPSEKDGDIDVLLIPLSRGIKDYFKPIPNIPEKAQTIAFEVKAGYLNKKQELKSSGLKPGNKNPNGLSKKQNSAREQAFKLCECGFDQVALLYAFPTTPATEINYGISSWFASSDSIEEIHKVAEKYIHTEKEDNFSTCYQCIGAVPEGKENEKGVLSELKFPKKVPNNILRNESFQTKLRNSIDKLFPYQIDPNHLPILLLACRNSSCKEIYLSSSDPYKKCPNCGSLPFCKYIPNDKK